MRSHFDQELDQLSQELIAMGTVNEKALGRVADLFGGANGEQMKEIQEEIRQFERRADDLERSIQSRALRLLCSQQPVARDLRFISTALNIITDMERIADQACDIAETAQYFAGRELVQKPERILEMTACCREMVSRSVDAFVAQDLQTAQDVINADDQVDELFLQARDEVVELINRSRESGGQAIDFIMIAKYLERIADHAVNIAEWVIFNITGEHKNQRILY